MILFVVSSLISTSEAVTVLKSEDQLRPPLPSFWRQEVAARRLARRYVRAAWCSCPPRDAGGGLYVGTYGVSHGSVPNMPTLTSCTIAGNTALWDGEDNVFIWANDRPHLVNTSIEGEWFRDAYMSAR